MLSCIWSVATLPPPGELISRITALTLSSSLAWRNWSRSASGVAAAAPRGDGSDSLGPIIPETGRTAILSEPLPDTYSSLKVSGGSTLPPPPLTPPEPPVPAMRTSAIVPTVKNRSTKTIAPPINQPRVLLLRGGPPCPPFAARPFPSLLFPCSASTPFLSRNPQDGGPPEDAPTTKAIRTTKTTTTSSISPTQPAHEMAQEPADAP